MVMFKYLLVILFAVPMILIAAQLYMRALDYVKKLNARERRNR